MSQRLITENNTMKLLIIEDDTSLREIMQRALQGEGYIVESAATYFDACDKIAGYSYDCIMLDIMLPDGNGLKLLEQIKKLVSLIFVIRFKFPVLGAFAAPVIFLRSRNLKHRNGKRR